MFSSGKNDWGTPAKIFDPLHAEFRFSWDVAATAESAVTPGCFFGPGSEHGENALDVPWGPFVSACWCNPPYSRGLQGKFIAKAAEESARGALVVMLLPARTDTKAFHRYIWNQYEHAPHPGVEVRFLKGRIRFVGAPAPAPFPSMVVVFRGAGR